MKGAKTDRGHMLDPKAERPPSDSNGGSVCLPSEDYVHSQDIGDTLNGTAAYWGTKEQE